MNRTLFDTHRMDAKSAMDILNVDEADRIMQLIEANTWPNKWTGQEPHADEPFDDGSGPTLFDDEDDLGEDQLAIEDASGLQPTARSLNTHEH